MKYYEGPFLDWLQQRPPGQLSPQTIAHVIRQAANVLQSAHDHGVVHQNISPSSFLVRATSEQPDFPDLQLIGFGQAQRASIWMAPEQWQGIAVAATDQYALAIIAYQLLAWQSPFQGTSDQLMYQHLNIQPQPPSQLNPNVPPGVDRVVLRALAKRPEDRFPSVSAFATAFQQAVQIPVSPPSVGIPQTQKSDTSRQASATNETLPPNTTHLSASSQIGEMLILGIVFLIVVSGIGFGFFSVVKNSQIAASTISTPNQTSATSPVILPSTTLTGIPYLEDNLSSNPIGRWDDDSTRCAFRGGSYHVLVHQAGKLQICGLTTPFILDNVAIEVDVSLLAGENAGLILRYDSQQLHFYDFEITNTGTFYFTRRDGAATVAHLISERRSSAIAPGGQKNTLHIIAKGSDFKLFINNVFVGEVHDNTYTSGQLGLVAGIFAPTTNGDASFSHLKVFKV